MSFFNSIKLYGLIFLLVSHCFSVQANDNQGINLYSGVVVDKLNNIAFIGNPQKGIDGVSLVDGSVVWHSDNADKPILLRNNQLIAQSKGKNSANLYLTSLDQTTGLVNSTKSFVLPDGIRADVNEGLEHKFNISSDYSSNPLGEIQWSHSYGMSQGAAPEVAINKKNIQKKVFGKISLKQSKAHTASGFLDKAGFQVLSKKSLQKKIAIEGKFIQQNIGRQFASNSKNHILVSQINDVTSESEKYKWQVYNLKNKLLGSFMYPNSYRPFEVVGDTVLFVTLPGMETVDDKLVELPLMIFAYSLSKGSKLWFHEIMDYSFKGPYPH